MVMPCLVPPSSNAWFQAEMDQLDEALVNDEPAAGTEAAPDGNECSPSDPPIPWSGRAADALPRTSTRTRSGWLGGHDARTGEGEE